MRTLTKIFITVIFYTAFHLWLNATTYYVSPTGTNGSYPTRGTFAAPWATFQYAIGVAQAGDTVYFRGGTYTMTASDGIAIYPNDGQGHNGTAGNPICYFAYPNDYSSGNIPIFDYSSVPDTEIKKGLRSDYLEYVHFKGFEIRNIEQYNPGGIVDGFGISYAKNIIIENVTLRNIGGAGFVTSKGINISYINCDAINCADPYSTSSSGPYGAGDGWQTNSDGVTNSSVYLKGCRAIFCSDDGYDSYWNDGTVVYDSCWALGDNHNGGEGNGWKLGRNFHTVSDSLQRKVTHCISVNHHTSGFNTNHIKGHTAVYNNVSYNDSVGFYHLSSGDYNYLVTIKNNIAHDYELSATYNFAGQPNVIHTNNTWNGGVTLTDADFIDIDTASLYADRQSDGSLPYSNFMKLRPISDLVEAGISDSISTVLDIQYYNTTPDIGWYEYSPGPQIIADHKIVANYENIPQYYIDSVKKMWLTVPGESHSAAYRAGLEYVEVLDAKYAVAVRTSGTPDAYTADNLRASRATWGDYNNATGWIYDYGEEDWWTNSTAISRTKAGITYANENNLEIAAIGFGWCYDHVNYYTSSTADPVYGCRWQGTSINGPLGEGPWGLDDADNTITGNSVNMDTYLSATQEYIDYCTVNGYSTKVFFTTAPVDNYYTGEWGYQGHLKQEHIRDYVNADTTRILFDYADILCYDDGSETPNTTTWNAETYPTITVTNEGDNGVGHIGEAGALRLGKAMWWMLARIAGWDGNVTVYTEAEEPEPGTELKIIYQSGKIVTHNGKPVIVR